MYRLFCLLAVALALTLASAVPASAMGRHPVRTFIKAILHPAHTAQVLLSQGGCPEGPATFKSGPAARPLARPMPRDCCPCDKCPKK